jgi:hypothetical protein
MMESEKRIMKIKIQDDTKKGMPSNLFKKEICHGSVEFTKKN